MPTELMLTVADIAAQTGLTPRTINLYRAAAERRLGVKFGKKSGKTTWFDANEVREILKSRECSDSGNPGNSENFREAVNFSNANAQAEESTLGGMERIVAVADQQAIAMGAAIGQRFNDVLWATAIQTMNAGMIEMQAQFTEMHQAIAIPLSEAPQLPGSNPNVAQLEGSTDG